MKKYIIAIILPFLFIMVGCNKDEFAKINTNPSTLDSPDLYYLSSQVIEQIYNNDYTVWFYNNFKYIYPWTQITAQGVGNSGKDFSEMGATGSQNPYSMYPTVRDLRSRIEALDEEKRNTLAAAKAVTVPALIQPFMTITDLTGSKIYSEAAMAPYTTPPLLTPKYDTQEELFNTWLEELDSAIADFTKENQYSLGKQDFIYGGDYKKWAKFSNLLKLKIAARLLNTDKAKALKIAEEVANSSVGYMNALGDDFIYNRGIKWYGTGNGTQPGGAPKNLVEFMVKNKDPRLRFIYTKNSFNAEVVQAFIDSKTELPSYIKPYVKLNAEGNFDGWNAPGEPWVRYFGAPLAPKYGDDAAYADYFDQGNRNKITVTVVDANGNSSEKTKTYRSTSKFSEFLTRTKMNFTFPTKPDGKVIQQKDNYPALKVILGTSAETNFYLAEFKVLGANLPKSAQEYFNQGVKLSVERLNVNAKDNRLPYYNEDPVYATKEAKEAGAIKLRDGEIDALLAQPDYDLTTNALEKIYLQQYITKAVSPNGDIWTLVRRTGYPKYESTIMAAEKLEVAGGEVLVIPRRFTLGAPSGSGINDANYVKAVEQQGFTITILYKL